MEISRSGLIMALGGGVIGDLTGFAAGILKRGVAFAQVPTTLLSQVDSSVGGKTGINTAQGKNLIGLFHQPRLVIADTALLSTLPRRELVAGYAEVVKYGALGDAAFFEWLEANAARALARRSPTAMVHAVAHSCQMKADIVARDERESGERALLNLGHTFGHALEALTGYSDRLLHGEGVAIGMALAFRLSVKLGLAPARMRERFVRHLKAVGLPSAISDIPGPRAGADDLIAAMGHDKKVADGKINFVLLRGLGKAFVTSDVPIDGRTRYPGRLKNGIFRGPFSRARPPCCFPPSRHHSAAADLGLFLRFGNRPDRRLARPHASAGKRWQPRRPQRQPPGGQSRAADRRPAAGQYLHQHPGLLAGDLARWKRGWAPAPWSSPPP